MAKFFERMLQTKYLLPLLIILLIVLYVFFWKAPPQKPPAEIKEKPVPPAKSVLHSALAGKWYPADAQLLANQIETFFEKADTRPIDNVIALILPHAGYQYSGQTATAALKALTKKYKRIIVIGPSHYVPMHEVLSVPKATHYQTPLGLTPLDIEFINQLIKYPMFQNVPRAHQYEHSVQIELPLLQYAQKDFKLVPIVAGSCSQETIDKAAAVLKGLLDEDTLVIASSDFVHYGPNYSYVPFTENIPDGIKTLDMGAYERIANLNSKSFLEYKQATGATICGSIPVAVLLSMTDSPIKAELLDYSTSGGLTADFTNSVSYLSVVFSGTWTKSSPPKLKKDNPGLTEQDKQQLLLLARKTIEYYLQNRRIPTPSDLNITLSDALRSPRAAFVTLEKNSQLRGCIGDIFPRQPLYESVITNAVNACVNDRRFLPVTPDECSDLTIEISALTVPQPVASADDIRIGTDGVVLNKNGKSAVFRPQVAPQQGWNRDQMLTSLSRKASLPPDAWKQGANFLVFQAEVFGEQQ